MDTNFSYGRVPGNYAQCLNQQCAQSQKCTRRLVAEHYVSKQSTISIINPNCIPEDTNTCPYFHVVRKIRMAWGVKRLLDNVPLKDAKILKAQMLHYFGRNIYYSLYRKERGITPEQQEYIRQIFRNKSIIEEPTFEFYTEEYQWS